MSTTTIPSRTDATHTADIGGTTASRPTLWKATLLASAGAAAVNLAIAAIATNADVPLTVDDSGKRIPALGFAQITLVCGLLGLAIAALCRRSRSPRRLFVTVAVALSIVSLVPPLLVDASVATRLVLELTHVVAAAVVIPVIASRLATAGPSRKPDLV